MPRAFTSRGTPGDRPPFFGIDPDPTAPACYTKNEPRKGKVTSLQVLFSNRNIEWRIIAFGKRGSSFCVHRVQWVTILFTDRGRCRYRVDHFKSRRGKRSVSHLYFLSYRAAVPLPIYHGLSLQSEKSIPCLALWFFSFDSTFIWKALNKSVLISEETKSIINKNASVTHSLNSSTTFYQKVCEINILCIYIQVLLV